MSKVVSEVEDDIKKVLARNNRELNTAMIKPIHKNHPFSSNGLYCFIGRPGSSKTFYMKHIMLSERLFRADGLSCRAHEGEDEILHHL